MAHSFERFGTAHIVVIALTLATPLALSALVRWYRVGILTKTVNRVLVTLLIGDKIVSLILLGRDGQLTIETIAPLYLCDWAAIVTVVTLIYPNQRTYELGYFWALGGTLQALLTPDLSFGFPDPRFIDFFGLHGGVIAAVLYLTLGMKMRPVPASIARVLAWTALYGAVAIATNTAFNTNFGYLRAKPAHPSLLDYLASWPFYIAQLAFMALVSCLICYLPFFIIDRRRRT